MGDSISDRKYLVVKQLGTHNVVVLDTKTIN